VIRQKVAAAVLAGLASVALAVTAATPAHASSPTKAAGAASANLAAPAPGGFYEIFTEFVGPSGPKCVDVPGASRSAGALLQVFHCVSGRNQLWVFNDMNNGFYQIENLNSAMCFELPSNSNRIEQANCIAAFTTEQWQIVTLSQGPTLIFGLVNRAFPTKCLAYSSSTGFPEDHAALVLKDCNLGTIVRPGDGSQIWALG